MRKEAFEPTGLIPRSIIRTFDRFLQQLLPGSEGIAIQEYQVSRYQILVSIKSLFLLICTPLIVNFTIKSLLLTPLTEHLWNSRQDEIFLNAYQEKRAFADMQDLSEKLFFESLTDTTDTNLEMQSKQPVSFGRETNDNTNSFSFLQSAVWNHLPYGAPNEETYLYHENQELEGFSKSCLYSTKGTMDPVSRDRTDITFENSAKRCKKSKKLIERGDFNTSSSTVSLSLPLLLTHAQSNLELKEPFLPEYSFIVPQNHSQNGKQKENRFVHTSLENKRTDLQETFQKQLLEIAYQYNRQSILAITNLLGDFVTFFTLYLLLLLMQPQIIILKSFLTESIYSLSDTTKSFLLILVMDLLVGFHSPRGWEIALEALLRHLGLPEEENFILLFVALFPVFLDTVFKYWIFRFLNKISPSTVVTYHSMLE